MSRMGRTRLVAVSSLVLLLVIAPITAPADAGDWSRFRGPNGSGLIEATGLPVEFGPENNVAWRSEVPFGRSSPAVGERQIFLTGIEEDQLVVVALDRKDGSEAWRARLARGHTADLHKATDSSTPSPVTDGTNVYVFFHEAGLVSYDATGKERWRKPIGPFRNYYGIAASPILAGDRLLMLCDQAQGSFLLALDKDSGKELWRRARPARLEAYTTPVLLADGSVLVYGSRWVDAYDPATGESRWALGGFGSGPISSPVTVDGWFFVISVQHAEKAPPAFSKLADEHDADGNGELTKEELEGSWMQEHFAWVNVDGKEGISEEDWRLHTQEVVNDSWGVHAVRLAGKDGKAEIAWNYKQNIPYIPSPLVHDGVFYMVVDGILTSLDQASGKLLKRGRLTEGSPKVYASPIAADGKLFVATLDGKVAVLRPGADWEVLRLNDLGDEIHATPAIADNRLLVRTRSAMYAFAAPPAESAPVTSSP